MEFPVPSRPILSRPIILHPIPSQSLKLLLYDRCDDRLTELIETRMLESPEFDLPFHVRAYEIILDTVLSIRELECQKSMNRVQGFMSGVEHIDLIPMELQENIR